MGLLTKVAILKAEDVKTETVKVPEWRDEHGNDEVLVRALTGVERDAFEETCYVGAGKDRRENFGNLRARLVAITVVGDDGALLFSPEDVKALGAKSAAALDRVYDAAQRLSGLRKQDVEALAGNSGAGQSAGT